MAAIVAIENGFQVAFGAHRTWRTHHHDSPAARVVPIPYRARHGRDARETARGQAELAGGSIHLVGTAALVQDPGPRARS
jgi:hypothetical protein